MDESEKNPLITQKKTIHMCVVYMPLNKKTKLKNCALLCQKIL